MVPSNDLAANMRITIDTMEIALRNEPDVAELRLFVSNNGDKPSCKVTMMDGEIRYLTKWGWGDAVPF